MPRYLNGDWDVSISLEDGSKVRATNKKNPVANFPESIDVKITDYCDAGCAWCHENSTVAGTHGNLNKIINLYEQLPAGVEIAIGGGNALDHPNLIYFLEKLKEHGVIANITVNQKHMKEGKYLTLVRYLINNNLIKGLGYSIINSGCEIKYNNLVTHVIAGIHSTSIINEIVKKGGSKILILGYKDFRRGNNYLQRQNNKIQERIDEWYRMLPIIINKIQVSLDNLAIKQLKPERMFESNAEFAMMYMGDDGSHTMYIDAVNERYAINSTSKDTYPLKSNIMDCFNSIKT